MLDFGISKVADEGARAVTLTHSVLGTPLYMSPEQVRSAKNVDARTDVWPLGVILYELLTGSTPFDAATVKAAMHGEVQRMIREVEPPRPSTRIHESRETLASICARRRTEPKRLGTLIRGELDWIVMKALEKDPRRRYASASEFAEDLRRHLANEPVSAGPGKLALMVQLGRGPTLTHYGR